MTIFIIFLIHTITLILQSLASLLFRIPLNNGCLKPHFSVGIDSTVANQTAFEFPSGTYPNDE